MEKNIIAGFKNLEKGMTLIEIMTSISIFLVVSALLYLAFGTATKYYTKGQRKAAVIQSSRTAMELISNALEEAKSFSEAGSTAVTFVQYDYDSNNDGSNDTIRFYLENVGGKNRLRKNVNGALERYLTYADENVTNLTFEYFSTEPTLDTNADGLADSSEIDDAGNNNGVLDGGDLGKINYLKVHLTLAKTMGGGTNEITLSSSVYARNLR